MFKKIKGKIKSIYEKMRFRSKLRSMDALWSFYGGSCFGLFPPSFYYKHSEEEIERLRQQEILKLKEILNEFQKRNENSYKF